MFIFSYLTLKARLNGNPPSFFRQIIALYAFNTAATEVLVLHWMVVSSQLHV